MIVKWIKPILPVLLSALFAGSIFANSIYPINEVRLLYGRGVEDAAAAKELLKIVTSGSQDDPLLIAYRGGAEALLAKHALNPYTKLDYLNKSMATLNYAIRRDANNPEIRFIRFTIQFYIPAFLGYSKNLQEDAHTIASNFSMLKNSADKQTCLAVGDFMIKSGKCSHQDIQYIREVLNAL